MTHVPFPSNCRRLFLQWAAALVGVTLAVSLSFAQDSEDGLPSYDIESLPDQSIWFNESGQSLSFQVTSAALGPSATITMSINEAERPEGSLSFDETSDTFSYTPAASDETPFKVTFLAVGDGSPLVAEIIIEPLQPQAPEYEAFGVEPDDSTLPDPESREYLRISDTPNNDSILFNETENTSTRSVTIIGKTVVIEEGHANGIYDSYHGVTNLLNFEIQAETIVVREAFHLPQTTLALHAHKLVFEDSEGEAVASISTTPLTPFGGVRPARENSTTQPDSTPGHAAGSMNLAIKEIEASGDSIRFIAKGGKGRDAILGLGNETRGYRTALNQKQENILFGGDADLGRSNVLFVWFAIDVHADVYRPSESSYWSSVNAWDGLGYIRDGQGNYAALAAKPAGKPGNGGSGGGISSIHNIDTIIDQSGGSAGAKAPTTPGNWGIKVRKYGDSSTHYTTAYRAKVELTATGKEKNRSWKTFTTHRSPTLSSPNADKPVGDSGAYLQEAESLSWLTPAALRVCLNYLNKAYLEGHLRRVDQDLTRYLRMIDDAKSQSEWGELEDKVREELEQLYDEFLALQHRIGSNLDYFGNPAGWVPMLSFEVNKLAFDDEIDRALRIMYLSYWLGERAETMQQSQDAMRELRGELYEQIVLFRDDYSEAVEEIPSIEAEANNLQKLIDGQVTRIKEIEQKLLPKAKSIVILKKTARTLGKIAQTIPVYQPALGAAGGAVAASADIDPNKSWEENAIYVGQGTANGFVAGKALPKAQAARSNANGINTSNTDDTNNQIAMDALRENQAELIGLLQDSYHTMTAEKGSNPEVEAELQRLLAKVPEYRVIQKDLTSLNLKKGEFIAKLTGLLQRITTLPIQISRNLRAIDQLNQEIQESSQRLNPETVSYLYDMDQRARSRLLKYHYFMAKAFNYRRLQAYTVSLDLNSVFDELKELADADGSSERMSAEEFESLRAVYEDQIAEVAQAILEDSNQNPSEKSIEALLPLPQEIIDQLNAGETVRLNLADYNLFPSSEENLRITDLFLKTMSMDYDASFATPNSADLVIQHSGISRIQKDGKTYLFRHDNASTRSLIEWKTRYQFADHSLVPSRPSAASTSLIGALVPEAQNLLVYSRPAANADLFLSLDSTANPNSRVVLESATLQLNYDFTARDQNFKFLKIVDAGNGASAPISIDIEDNNGRESGHGSFSRTYNVDTVATLTAPLTFGDLEFVRWEGTGVSNPSDPRQVVTLSSDLTLTPIYQPATTYTLDVINGSGSGTYPAGEVVTIQAESPGTGSNFLRWEGGQPDLRYSPVTQISLFEDATLTAVFESSIQASVHLSPATGERQLDLTVESDDYDQWTVQTSPDLKQWTDLTHLTLSDGMATTTVSLGEEATFFQVLPSEE